MVLGSLVVHWGHFRERSGMPQKSAQKRPLHINGFFLPPKWPLWGPKYPTEAWPCAAFGKVRAPTWAISVAVRVPVAV
jgi:hypothetical protein